MSKRYIKRIMLLLLVLVLGNSSLSAQEITKTNEQKKAYMVIIIDDFGNNMKGTDEILKLPIKITGAVIPGMPFAKEEAQKLHEAGKEVMIHVPLEPIKGKREWLGPMGIFAGMKEEKIVALLNKAKEEVPFAQGMNNHMGSKAMQDKVIVSTLMKQACANQYYFVDSGTTDDKLSRQYSMKANVPFLKRDVFLDNTASTEHVKGKLRELQQIAKEKGYAVGIGHVGLYKGEHTARALKELIPQLEKEGIIFVTPSELLQRGVIDK